MSEYQTPQTPETPAQAAPRRANGVVVAVSIVGGALLLAAVAAAVVAGILSAGRGSAEAQIQTVDTRGVAELRVDTSSADFVVAYDGGAPDRALLETSEGPRQWELRRDGDALVVESKRVFFFDWFSFGPGTAQTVILRLPESLREQPLDAEFRVSSGGLQVEGGFDELEVDVSSGSAQLSGEARTLDAELSSGRLEFSLADVEEVDIRTSSGQARGEITGAAPREVEVGVSSGSTELELPDASYAVSTQASSGRIENLLRTDPSSRRTVEARVSSGSVTLRPAASAGGSADSRG